MIEQLLHFDRQALLFFNEAHTPALDNLMKWTSATTSWIPLYIALLLFIIYRERPRLFIYTLIFAALTVVLCDQISVWIKNWVERPRPSHDPIIAASVHIVDGYRGGAWGFVSSHAANTFGIAAYIARVFKKRTWAPILLFAWATFVSFSRIYLGVHYPLDIICGAALGILVGTQCYTFRVRMAAFAERRIHRKKKRQRQ